MQIFIEPSDVLIFRDGHPFFAGEDHRAVSIFPPYPFTVQGMVRSARIAQARKPFDHQAWPGWLRDEIGTPDDFGALRLSGPFVARKENGKVVRYFPLPTDVVYAGCSHTATLAPLHPDEWRNHFDNNLPDHEEALCPLWHRGATRVEPAKGWLSEAELSRYLDGLPFRITHEEELFVREPRFHVEIDGATKRPKQGDSGGHLFQMEYVRLNAGVGLWLQVDGVQLALQGFLQVGGEARAAVYHRIKDPVPLVGGGSAGGRFKLYFATPAFLGNGWAANQWADLFGGAQVRLVCAAVPRPAPVGGFDIAKGIRRPIRHFVPAGSVYYFETESAVTVPPCIIDTITDQTTSADEARRLRQIGFGQVFIGRWAYV